MVDNNRVMNTIFDTEIEELYLINGLSRSGNHLFISWLISSFLPGETYFLNNISNIRRIENPADLDIKLLTITCIASSNHKHDQGQYFLDKDIRNNLVTYQEVLNLLYGKKEKIKKLVLSIENNYYDMLDLYQERFKRAKKVYKIIILRDILNVLASRFTAERELIKEIKKNMPEFAWHKYDTDIFTVGYWTNNFYIPYPKKLEFIIFNYNKFVIDEKNRRDLAFKLNIDYQRTKIKQTGFLKGSSFKNKNNPDIFKYFFRWLKYKDEKLIQFLFQDKYVRAVLSKYFDYHIIDDNTVMINHHRFDIKKKLNETKDEKKDLLSPKIKMTKDKKDLLSPKIKMTKDKKVLLSPKIKMTKDKKDLLSPKIKMTKEKKDFSSLKLMKKSDPKNPKKIKIQK